LVEVRRRLRHGVDFLDRIYRIYRMKKSGGCDCSSWQRRLDLSS
jgi:hypothetical protein